jgi:hypothetical protein
MYVLACGFMCVIPEKYQCVYVYACECVDLYRKSVTAHKCVCACVCICDISSGYSGSKIRLYIYIHVKCEYV